MNRMRQTQANMQSDSLLIGIVFCVKDLSHRKCDKEFNSEVIRGTLNSTDRHIFTQTRAYIGQTKTPFIDGDPVKC